MYFTFSRDFRGGRGAAHALKGFVKSGDVLVLRGTKSMEKVAKDAYSKGQGSFAIIREIKEGKNIITATMDTAHAGKEGVGYTWKFGKRETVVFKKE